MLQNLDQHSSFINTSEWKQFRRQIEGKFGGIGIQVGVDPETGRLRVIAPMVGTPAYEAGVLAGDQIMEIDGQSAEGMSPDKAVEVLTGRPGTEVKLTVLHEGIEQPETVTITRAIIKVPSVLGDHRKADDQWDFMLDKDKKIGYVRITSFIQNTADELQEGPRPAQGRGAKGLILDLRDDPGGLLSSAVEVSDMFSARARSSAPRAATPSPRPTWPRRTAPSKTSRWSCWSTRTRLRPPRSSRPPSRTTSGPSSSASGLTAKARSRTSSISTTATACSS